MSYDKVKTILELNLNTPKREAEIMQLIQLKKISLSLAQLRRILNSLSKNSVIKFEMQRYGQKRVPTRFYSLK